MDKNALRRLIDTRLAIPVAKAGQALGLGRSKTKQAVEAGQIPTTATGTVPTEWLEKQLQRGLDRQEA